MVLQPLIRLTLLSVRLSFPPNTHPTGVIPLLAPYFWGYSLRVWGCLRGGENPLFTLKGWWVGKDKIGVGGEAICYNIIESMEAGFWNQ